MKFKNIKLFCNRKRVFLPYLILSFSNFILGIALLLGKDSGPLPALLNMVNIVFYFYYSDFLRQKPLIKKREFEIYLNYMVSVLVLNAHFLIKLLGR